MEIHKNRLLNLSEEKTFRGLEDVCSNYGVKVYPKIRIADVFKLEGSGICDSWFKYALMAHFDFLVTTANFQPLFCVEYDGPQHQRNARQMARDRLKDSICDYFQTSILRINSNYLNRKFRGCDLLTYFIEAWFTEKAFNESQAQGLINADEVFDLRFILCDSSRPEISWPYWLSRDIDVAFAKMYERKMIRNHGTSYFSGRDAAGNHRCISWIEIDDECLVYTKTGMRVQRFPSVDSSDLLSMIASFDLHELVRQAVGGNKNMLTNSNLFYDRILTDFQRKYHLAGSVTCTSRGAWNPKIGKI